MVFPVHLRSLARLERYYGLIYKKLVDVLDHGVALLSQSPSKKQAQDVRSALLRRDFVHKRVMK
jgi:hypothetical protein